MGAFQREITELPQERALETLRSDYDLDEFAAGNVFRYLNEQREATRAVPSDRTVVIERFRDEIGDWRLCVLTPFGGRVHAAWAMALSARLRDERGLDPDAIWSDDGVILHLPDADEPPPSDLAMLDPDELEDLVTAELGNTALFGSRFREAAARSLLIPRRMPDRRTPLWQQRLKAQGLLQVARHFGEFPVDARDVSRVPAGLARPARSEESAGATRAPRGGAGGRRDADRLALCAEPAVRLHRHIHVRGRRTAGGAARRGAGARPRPAARAARRRGAARADRPGRAGLGRGGPPAAAAGPPRRATPTSCTTCCGRSATSPTPSFRREWCPGWTRSAWLRGS